MKRCAKCGKDLSDDALFCPRCGTKQVSGTDLVGTMLADRYLVQAEIGRGGSGTVYRARHVSLGTHVAVKVLHPSLSSDEAAMERFRKEAVTVASIDNEHAVHVFDFGRLADGRFYMVMELLDGQTLDQRFEEGRPLEVSEAMDITVQAAEALAEVHAIGFVHRDLRPRNIFLAQRKGRKNFVKILDFGMSKLLSPGVSPQATLGIRFSDPVYIAPEQIRGEPVDRRTDIYSLAVLLYEMLTGRPPFSGEGTVALLDQQLEKMPPVPSRWRPGLPPLLDAAVLKALAKNPESRFATMIEFRDALIKAIEPSHPVKQELQAGADALSGGQKAGQGAKTPGAGRAGIGRMGDGSEDVSSPGRLPVDLAPDQTVLGLGGPVPPPAARDSASDSMAPDRIRGGDGGSREVGEKRSDGHRGHAGDSESARRPKGESGQGDGGGPAHQERRDGPVGPGVVSGKDRTDAKEPGGEDVQVQGQSGQRTVEQSETGPSDLERVPGPVSPTGEADETVESVEAMDGEVRTGRTTSDDGLHLDEQQPDPTMSQIWYSEGEEAQRALAALEGQEGEGQATLPAMYRQMQPRRHGASGRLLLTATLTGLVVVFLLVGFLLWHHRSGEGNDGQESVATAPAHPDAGAALERDAGMRNRDMAVSPGQDAGPQAKQDAAILSLPRDEFVVSEGGSSKDETRSRRPARPRTRPGGPVRRSGPSEPRNESRPAGGAPRSGAEDVRQRALLEIEAGRTALKIGDLAAAKNHFLKAKSLGAGRKALAGLGEVAFEQGRYAEAVRLLKRASRSGTLRTMLLLGDAYFKLGKLQRAKAVYERVLRKSPSNRAAKRNLEVVRRRLGESG